MVEGRNGIGKRRYGLDLIMAYLAETGKTEAAFIILAMNVAHLLRFLLALFWRVLKSVNWTGESVGIAQAAVGRNDHSANRFFQQALLKRVL